METARHLTVARHPARAAHAIGLAASADLLLFAVVFGRRATASGGIRREPVVASLDLAQAGAATPPTGPCARDQRP